MPLLRYLRPACGASLVIFALKCGPLAFGQFSIASQGELVGTGTTAVPNYDVVAGTNTYFTNINVQAGDFLVMAHANNKRNGTIAANANAITATIAGITDSFTRVATPDSGGTAGAWIFYTPISQSGTISSITLTTDSTTKTVAQVSAYYLLRPSSGQVLVLGATDGEGGTGATTRTLDFAYSSNNTGFFALTAASAAGAALNLVNPSASTVNSTSLNWTEEISGASLREIYYTANQDSVSPAFTAVPGTSSFSVSSQIAVAAAHAFVGVVVLSQTAAIPEPSTYAAIFGTLALGAVVLRRRRQAKSAARQ